MKRKILSIGIVIVVMYLFSGCASDQKNLVVRQVVHVKKDKPYQFTYTPVIGSQNPDEKVVVDMGVVLRIWINSYKDRYGNLVASHDIYSWMKKPNFIPGVAIPVRNRGILSPDGKMPVMLSNDEVDRSNFNDNENIKKYVNSIYEKASGVKKETPRKYIKYDKKIKEFIKKVQKHKDTNKKHNKDTNKIHNKDINKIYNKDTNKKHNKDINKKHKEKHIKDKK